VLAIELDAPTTVVIDGAPYNAGPGTLRFHRKGPNWELTT
jgi:hypothetical protein